MQPTGTATTNSSTDSTARISGDDPASNSEAPKPQAEEQRSAPTQGLFALMQRANAEVTPSEIDDLLEGLQRGEEPTAYDRLPSARSLAKTSEIVDDEFESDPLELPDAVDGPDVSPDEVTAAEIDDLLEELDDDGSSSDIEQDFDVSDEAHRFSQELPDVDNEDGAVPARSSFRVLPPLNVIELDQLEPLKYRRAEDKARRQCWIGLVCGIASAAGSTLALLPQFWSSIPATILGFGAIIAGYLAVTGASRRQLPSMARTAALVGMFLGTAGIFLGPLLFAGLGKNLRDETGQLATSRHLKQMAGAIDRFYGDKDEYPVGGTFARDEAGVIRGQHGWMTFLLPFVGETELYHRIDQDKPFDDSANRVAMGQDVAPYFAAGGDRSKIGQGFAVSHFAGLGGEIDNAGGLSHVGVFERDVAVKRDEITDGLATTMIIGELAGGYPPWGDPENWRKIGRGLNKDPNGFGSAGGHGASFLFADGSVKHFSNKTDPKLLERLSTRDGGE